MPIILRSEKGSALSHGDMDGNFTVARNNENAIAVLQSDVAALQATVPIGELVVPAAMMTARGNVTVNPAGHPVVRLQDSGVNEISTTLVHMPPNLRGIDLTATAYFDVEDLGGQVRLTWDIHDVGSGPSPTSFTTTIGPDPTGLNPQVLATTLQLTGAGPASMADFLIRRDSGDAADTYGGTLDFYMFRIEATVALASPLASQDNQTTDEPKISEARSEAKARNRHRSATERLAVIQSKLDAVRQIRDSRNP